jgi:hypothetical protein
VKSDKKVKIIMKNKTNLLLIFLFTFFFSIPSGAFLSYAEKPKTPYGDFCNHISRYGTSKKMHSHKQSEKALKHYFNSKGLDVEIITSKGRFLKANVKKKGKTVDTIIFDRRTGRIRSIY